MSSLLFESYRGLAPGLKPPRDEWRGGLPDVREAYDHVETVLSRSTPQELERLTRRAQDLMREQGATFAHGEGAEKAERTLPFDLFPLTVSAEEWARLVPGLAQRVRAWNCLLRDVYSGQEILKAGVIPYEVVYGDPRYARECVGLKPVADLYVHAASVDLFRGADGRWVAVEDSVSNATGAAYALQNRRALAQLCPVLMEGRDILPVHHYPTQLLETLQAVSPTGRSTARVVLLSPGAHDEAYFDHSSLARQMGVPLVQGGDLIVLDNHVYLKTIAGLERVEVIYRRLASAEMDPITFRPDSLLGVPGLVSCVRKGTVSIANALGADIADSRALNAYMPQIVEFYLNEQVLLPTVPTWLCRDLDVREQLYEDWDRYVVKETVRRKGGVAVGAELSGEEREALKARIEAAPASFVIQPALAVSTAPAWSGSALEPRHVGLRAFVLDRADEPLVTSCVLTRYALSPDSLIVSPAAGGGNKDTWILRPAKGAVLPAEAAADDEEGAVFAPPRSEGRMPLGSRTAESLYWIGRYAERAEATTRILRVVQQLRVEGVSRDPRSWEPLWDALASATGHSPRFFKRPTLQKPLPLAQYILLEEDNYASALSCLQRCRRNAQSIREALPPEVWTVLNGLYLDLASAAARPSDPLVLERLQSLALQDELLTRLDELSGSVEKHMLHDDAWHFWQIGRHLERALFTTLTMRQVYLKRSDEGRSSGGLGSGDDNLDALLRMLAGQYAYRSSYQGRPVGSQVARLLIQDGEFPRSIVFCLESILESLQRTFGERPSRTDTPLHYCHHLLSELMFADIPSYFPTEQPRSAQEGEPHQRAARARQRGRAFAERLHEITHRLFNLGTQVSDHYLNHQAAPPLRGSQ